MFKRYIILLAVLVLFASSAYSFASVVGTSHIRAPAVILENNSGSITNISLTITTGNGAVKVTGPAMVGSSTNQSAYTAAQYASNYTGQNFTKYNFTYFINDSGGNVSGPSAGAAMTLLAVSAFYNKPLRNDFTITGTISSNGSIGEIGGVYDKAGAAKNLNLALVLVPKVAPTDQEDELYFLVQTNFGIPLVQVANISQAAYFAFNPNLNGLQNQTTYNFYNNYNISALPNAPLNCSTSCNYTTFNLLLNATFNLTRTQINELNQNPKFYNISAQFNNELNQSMAIANHGYIYTGADFAFLTYVNSFYFNGYSTNRTSALNLLLNVQSFCNSLTPPPLTASNYNYVINAELRQAWGNYTINNVVNSYNSSQIDSDQILDELFLGAQANGWCTAANLVYNEAGTQSATYLEPSSALSGIATQRINRATPYGETLYLTTAQQAYKSNNYPVAIIDADYAFALANASEVSTYLSVQQLDNLSSTIAQNSTYGVWATEFAKESFFYSSESKLTTNATIAKSDAISSYSSALLAQQISNDTKIIQNNLVAAPAGSVSPQIQNSNIIELTNYLTRDEQVISALLLIIIMLLIVIIVLILVVISKLSTRKEQVKTKRKR